MPSARSSGQPAATTGASSFRGRCHVPNRASTGEVWPLAEHTQILTLGLHTTFVSLRHSNFRIYFAAQIGSNIGSWIQITAENWLVLQLAHSGLALGITNALQFGPLVVFGLYGGVIADRFDRRRLQYWDPRRRPDRRTISCDIGQYSWRVGHVLDYRSRLRRHRWALRVALLLGLWCRRCRRSLQYLSSGRGQATQIG